MRKIICTILTAFTVWFVLPFTYIIARAAEDDMTFFFEMTVDGKDTKEVQTGDIITLVLKLKRTDVAKAYTMYAMQDELRYDSTFLELVEGSAVLSNGIVSTDIAMVDQFREFYMNYLSMSGGTQWNADTLVGSVQFKVIGEHGVTKITSQDYLVSLKDGSGSYECDAGEVTIVLSTECKVSFKTNGGSEIPDQTVRFGEKISRPEDPTRAEYRFEGWYKDIHLRDAWDFENDTVQGNLSLYAKWNVVEDENVDSSGGEAADEVLGNVGEDKDSTAGGDVATGDVNQFAEYWWWVILIIILILLLIICHFRRKQANQQEHHI